MAPFLWVTFGSALGGLLRYVVIRLTFPINASVPWSTMAINVLGSFLIGWFGTFTLAGGRYPASANLRLFVMVGVCGGFTTFSSFSLETFDLLRGGAWARALLNAGLSVLLCLGAVAAGHYVGQQGQPGAIAVAETAEEELSG